MHVCLFLNGSQKEISSESIPYSYLTDGNLLKLVYQPEQLQFHF